MTLRLLFSVHAIVTFAAGVVLVVAPAAILAPSVFVSSPELTSFATSCEVKVWCDSLERQVVLVTGGSTDRWTNWTGQAGRLEVHGTRGRLAIA
jgi:hypothetical protein